MTQVSRAQAGSTVAFRLLAGAPRPATSTAMTARKIKLVAIVPRPRPPFARDWDSRSPSEAPSGRVRM